MKILHPTLLALAFSTSVALTARPADAATKDIVLPPATVQLKPTPLPGYTIALQKCGICHSADYVAYQPPSMTLTQWTAEMTKMQKAYGAPISDEEIKLLGVYLASAYGDAKTVSDADRALQPIAAAQPPDAKASDVQTLLAANGCLACHAVDKAVVGPAYHDVRTQVQSRSSSHGESLGQHSCRWGGQVGDGADAAVQRPGQRRRDGARKLRARAVRPRRGHFNRSRGPAARRRDTDRRADTSRRGACHVVPHSRGRRAPR